MAALNNPKHERFCREYVKDLNATQAYIRAGYSQNGADASAARLLVNARVRDRIAELQAKVAGKLEITQESVLREIEETRLAALGADQHATALKAAELKGKHIGMWPNKALDRLTDSLETLINGSMKADE